MILYEFNDLTNLYIVTLSLVLLCLIAFSMNDTPHTCNTQINNPYSLGPWSVLVFCSLCSVCPTAYREEMRNHKT